MFKNFYCVLPDFLIPYRWLIRRCLFPSYFHFWNKESAEMSLIALFEELMTEHGAPTLLKKRLELLGNQISVLEKKNRRLELDHTLLKSKKNTIESHLNQTRKEIERLNQFIEELEKDDAKTRLDGVTESVLKMFFYRRREMSVSEVAGTLSIDVRTTRYQFDLLLQKKLIEQTRAGFVSLQDRRRNPQFRITSSGREYIFRKIRS
jgi:transcription termination factor NusB